VQNDNEAIRGRRVYFFHDCIPGVSALGVKMQWEGEGNLLQKACLWVAGCGSVSLPWHEWALVREGRREEREREGDWRLA
jgi:hypothetical protein